MTSRYVEFGAKEWAELRANTPLELTESEVKRLRSLGDHIDLAEVERIYLSLSRLLSTHVETMHKLRGCCRSCLGVGLPRLRLD